MAREAEVTDTQCLEPDQTQGNDRSGLDGRDATAGSTSEPKLDGNGKRRGEIRVYKKSSLNGKITVYLGKRDFVDHISYVDPIDGVVLIDRDYVKGKKVYGHVLATFSYGRDDLDVLGLTFRKELYLVNEQIFPDPLRKNHLKGCPYYVEGQSDTSEPNPDTENIPPRPLTHLQERLVKKLGPDAFPFFFELPPLCPASVTLQPGPGDSGKPCGVDYELKAFIANSLDEKPSKRDSIRLAIRKIVYAPTRPGEQPMVEVSKDFMMSPNKLNLEVSLDKDLYYHGESIAVNVHVSNNSNRTVKKVKVSVRQFADICLFSTAHYKCTVAEVESEEGCPVGPGATLSKVYFLRPLLAFNKDKRGLALDGQLKHEDTNLASTTVLTEHSQKENLGIVVQYKVRVKLLLGPLGGEISAELPVTLMHPKPEYDDEQSESRSKIDDRLDNPNGQNPLDAIFGRKTACKCRGSEKTDGKERPELKDETKNDGQDGKREADQDLIQLDDDNDIIFEDFARLKFDPPELSCSSRSNEDDNIFTPNATTDIDHPSSRQLTHQLSQSGSAHSFESPQSKQPEIMSPAPEDDQTKEHETLFNSNLVSPTNPSKDAKVSAPKQDP